MRKEIKLIALCLALVACLQAQAHAQSSSSDKDAIKLGSLNLTGSLRVRAEGWDWFESSLADNRYNFGAATLTLSLGQQLPRLDWQVEGAFPLLINLPADAIAPAPQGQLGMGASYYAANGRQDGSAFIKQAFIRVKNLAGDKASSLKIGRFEFNDGTETTPSDASLAVIKRDHIAQRLIGTFGFTHVGRSFDGIQFVHNTNAGNLTFVAARPTEGVFQLRGWNELDVDFYYGAYTKPFQSKNTNNDLRVFALYYHDGRRVLKTDNRPQDARAGDNEKIRVMTLGGHYIANVKAGTGKTDFLLWGCGQFGDWGNLNHSASAIAIEAGYQFGFALKPWIRTGYFRGSGDGNAGDDSHGTFFQVLPTPRPYARFPFFNLMNNQDAFAQLRLEPHKKVRVRSDIRYLQLTSNRDLWYLGGGAFQQQTFGYIGRPSGGKRKLGILLDVSADFTLSPKTTATLYFAGVKGGSVVENIYFNGRNGGFAYVELTRRF